MRLQSGNRRSVAQKTITSWSATAAPSQFLAVLHLPPCKDFTNLRTLKNTLTSFSRALSALDLHGLVAWRQLVWKTSTVRARGAMLACSTTNNAYIYASDACRCCWPFAPHHDGELPAPVPVSALIRWLYVATVLC